MLAPRCSSLGDADRLCDLRETDLLDSPPEESIDRFSRLARQILNVPVVLLSLVEMDRQFFKSQLGLPDEYAQKRETPLSHSFCQHVVNTGDPLIISDARLNPLVQENLAIRDLHVIAYLGIPILSQHGRVLGSFCAIDSVPREWTPREISTMSDLAAALSNEIHLRTLRKNLAATNDALLTARAEQDSLMHMIVHDLRTPLGSFLTGLDLVRNYGPLNHEQTEFIDLAQRGGHHLLEMINDLLDIHTLEQNGLTIEREVFDPNLIWPRIENQVRYLAQEKRQTLEFQISEGLPLCQGDHKTLIRVLVNLIGNAIKFTPNKGRITCAASLNEDRQAIHFRVADNGPGIASEQLDYIFKKFAVVPGKNTGKMRSTGLGLTFSKMVVEAHGGQIKVRSEEGQGSVFSFDLPLNTGRSATSQ